MNKSRTWRIIALVTIVTAAGLLLMACGGGDDDPDTTVTVSPEPNPSLDAGATQQLRDLAGKWGETVTKITYALNSASGSLTNASQVVLYQEGPDRRIDNIGVNGTATVIVRTSLGYTCLDTTSTCALLTTEEANSAAEFVPFVSDLADNAGLKAIIAGATELESAPARNVIGRETSCLKAAGNLGGIQGEATWCFTEDGLLLAINYSGGAQTFDMTATTIEGTKATDFEPPYTVATLPPTATP